MIQLEEPGLFPYRTCRLIINQIGYISNHFNLVDYVKTIDIGRCTFSFEFAVVYIALHE